MTSVIEHDLQHELRIVLDELPHESGRVLINFRIHKRVALQQAGNGGILRARLAIKHRNDALYAFADGCQLRAFLLIPLGPSSDRNGFVDEDGLLDFARTE